VSSHGLGLERQLELSVRVQRREVAYQRPEDQIALELIVGLVEVVAKAARVVQVVQQVADVARGVGELGRLVGEPRRGRQRGVGVLGDVGSDLPGRPEADHGCDHQRAHVHRAEHGT
jgi:hypothetical protein